MTQPKSNNTRSHGTYPGEYVPAPLTIDEVWAALQHPQEGASVPLVNVVDTQDAFLIEVAAPGLNSSHFLVSIYQSVLSVSVLQKDLNDSNKTYHQHEFNYSCFKRDIALPNNIDTDFLNALYRHGILYVMLPKSKKGLTKTVGRVIVY